MKIVNKLVRSGRPERRFGKRDVRKCWFVVNIAFGVHLAETIMKIGNILVRIGIAIADSDRIRLGSCCPRLTLVTVPKRSFSENFRQIDHELVVESGEKKERRKKKKEQTDKPE